MVGLMVDWREKFWHEFHFILLPRAACHLQRTLCNSTTLANFSFDFLFAQFINRFWEWMESHFRLNIPEQFALRKRWRVDEHIVIDDQKWIKIVFRWSTSSSESQPPMTNSLPVLCSPDWLGNGASRVWNVLLTFVVVRFQFYDAESVLVMEYNRWMFSHRNKKENHNLGARLPQM